MNMTETGRALQSAGGRVGGRVGGTAGRRAGRRAGGTAALRGHGRTDGRTDGGAGTLLMAGLALLALLLIGSATLLVQATAAASQAASAADLAALAAADAVRGLTDGEPCAVAREVAERHAAALTECRLGGSVPGTAVVRVSVHVAGIVPDATGAARAGPPP